VKRAAAGKPARLPHWAMVHVLAVTYGQDPELVASWPADRYLEAVNLLELTMRLRHG
jgi:hypothetical protein